MKADPKACQQVFTAPWDMTITPLDTCGPRAASRASATPASATEGDRVPALIENYRLWCPNHDWCAKDAEYVAAKSSTLFDTVAVYLAISRDLVTVERLGVEVGDDGSTKPAASGRALGWATDWKSLDAYEELLVARITGPAVPARTGPAAAAARP